MAEEFEEKLHSITAATGYGYGGRITNIRDKEFPNLQDIVYLDHTGSTLYAKSQVQRYHEDLLKNTYGNPHSSCLSSELTSQMIDDVRQQVLSFFNTSSDEYHVVFTSNATSALKLIAENFKFDSEASSQQSSHREENSSVSCANWFVYLQDNHTSVVGIRAVALNKGVQIRSVTHEESSNENLNLHFINCTESHETNHFSNVDQTCSIDHVNNIDKVNNLFAFPAMSNFSGHKYPLEWINVVQGDGPFSRTVTGKWFVLLDAATFVSTSSLNLSSYQPDFVPISFYKLFGLPTGLGALLVSVRGADALRKSYFSGGTVSAYSSDTDFHVFKPSMQDRYEDGTPPFLEILSLKYGFEILAKLTTTMDLITQHTFCLAHFVYNKLKKLRHYNGKIVCQIYCDTDYKTASTQGPIINFNLLRSSGVYVGYTEVSKLASVYNIHLRTGCFCNVGACQHFLNLTSEQLRSNLKAGHVCGDGIDLINGCPTGSVRISFGYMSDFSDAERFIVFIKECFLEKLGGLHSGNGLRTISENKEVLKKMFVYPIKSCAAFEVQQWDMNEKGFCYDREWLIVNEAGAFLGQKREPRLCLIKPSIDLKRNVLRMEAPGMSPCELPLQVPLSNGHSLIIQPRICGTKVSGIDCGDEVSEWLTSFFKKKCRLLRQNPNITRKSTLSKGERERVDEHAISLSNESQMLMITEASCLDLLRHIKTSIPDEETCKLTVETLIQRFRPNLVISGVCLAYEEESWNSLTIDSHRFQSCGACHRCQMICVDQSTGERSKEPLRTLARIRGSKIPFGVHLLHIPSEEKESLSVGNIVQPKCSPEPK